MCKRYIAGVLFLLFVGCNAAVAQYITVMANEETGVVIPSVLESRIVDAKNVVDSTAREKADEAYSTATNALYAANAAQDTAHQLQADINENTAAITEHGNTIDALVPRLGTAETNLAGHVADLNSHGLETVRYNINSLSSSISAHKAATNNPHNVTAAQVGAWGKGESVTNAVDEAAREFSFLTGSKWKTLSPNPGIDSGYYMTDEFHARFLLKSGIDAYGIVGGIANDPIHGLALFDATYPYPNNDDYEIINYVLLRDISTSAVERLTLNGDTYLPVDGVVDLGDIGGAEGDTVTNIGYGLTGDGDTVPLAVDTNAIVSLDAHCGMMLHEYNRIKGRIPDPVAVEEVETYVDILNRLEANMVQSNRVITISTAGVSEDNAVKGENLTHYYVGTYYGGNYGLVENVARASKSMNDYLSWDDACIITGWSPNPTAPGDSHYHAHSTDAYAEIELLLPSGLGNNIDIVGVLAGGKGGVDTEYEGALTGDDEPVYLKLKTDTGITLYERTITTADFTSGGGNVVADDDRTFELTNVDLRGVRSLVAQAHSESGDIQLAFGVHSFANNSDLVGDIGKLSRTYDVRAVPSSDAINHADVLVYPNVSIFPPYWPRGGACSYDVTHLHLPFAGGTVKFADALGRAPDGIQRSIQWGIGPAQVNAYGIPYVGEHWVEVRLLPDVSGPNWPSLDTHDNANNSQPIPYWAEDVELILHGGDNTDIHWIKVLVGDAGITDPYIPPDEKIITPPWSDDVWMRATFGS